MLSLTVALKTYRKRINTLHFLAVLSTSYSPKCSHFRSFLTHYSQTQCPPNQLPQVAWNLAPALESHWHTSMDHIYRSLYGLLSQAPHCWWNSFKRTAETFVTPFLGSKIDSVHPSPAKVKEMAGNKNRMKRLQSPQGVTTSDEWLDCMAGISNRNWVFQRTRLSAPKGSKINTKDSLQHLYQNVALTQ